MSEPKPSRARDITAADLAVQDPCPRVIPEAAVPDEVRAFLDGGGVERWLERREEACEEACEGLEDAALLRMLEERALRDRGRLTPVDDVAREFGFADLLDESSG